MIGVIGTLYGFFCIFSILATGTCVCDQGFEVSSLNSSECADVDECSLFGSCSQICENTVGSFQCSCIEGFEVTENNNRSCSPIDTKWNLVYATRYDVGYIARGNNGRVRKYQITQNGARPVAVTYDARNNITYWTDASSNAEAIYRRSLSRSSTIEVVADTGMLLPEGIAFDWITGNIYFADSNLSHIGICRNDSNLCVVLIQQEIDKPRDIALHPNQGIMFYTDWGNTPAIMRTGMDGSFPLAIVSSGLQWPNGITVDQGNGRIYWVDARMDRIETALFDGSDRHIVPTGNTKHPFGIDVFGDRIFWSDWSSNEIKSVDKFSGQKSIVHLADPQTLINGVALFHVANQPILRSNPCNNSRCSHICALSPTSSYRCFCPVGMVLDETDSKTCVEPDDVPKIVIGFKSTLKTMRFNSIGREVFGSITIPNIKSINAMTYNPINHTLILSDSATKKIYEYNINRNRTNVLIDQHLDMVRGMDIDLIGENLYWVDAGKKTVEAMSFRTRKRIVLMSGVENPYDILVVPEIRSLFLTRMTTRGGRLFKMFPNTHSSSVIQRVGDKEPIAITFDKEFQHVLWADKVYRRIESVSIDGVTAATIVAKQEGPPTDVVKYGNQIFWTDMFSQELKSISVGSQNVRKIKLGNFLESNSTSFNNNTTFFAKMAVIDRDIGHLEDLRNKHDCSIKNPKRKKCSHICLLNKDEFSGDCLCPEGLSLDEDGMTCIKISTCSQDQFTCSDGSCIHRSYVCDGVPDCTHNEDEVNCRLATCSEGNFKCGSGVCVPNHWVCDGENDCPDGTDEHNCTFVPCNEDFDFRCESTSRCIPKSWRCDHAFDCPGDDSDERGCNFTCPDGFFQCTTTQQCILSDWVCDKEKDCEDGTDEPDHCVHNCADNQFECRSGKCIDRSLVCDGSANCAHNEDEENCEKDVEGGEVNNRSNFTGMPVMENIEDDESHGATVAIVLGILIIIVLVAIIIALVLHKRNIQPKVLVRPYVQQWNKYVHEPARRFFDGKGQQKLDCEKNIYDEVYPGGSATYYNTAVYEDVDGATDFEPSSPEKRSPKDSLARSFADSGILGSERESLYEEAEECGSHYVSYNQKDKLLTLN